MSAERGLSDEELARCVKTVKRGLLEAEGVLSDLPTEPVDGRVVTINCEGVRYVAGPWLREKHSWWFAKSTLSNWVTQGKIPPSKTVGRWSYYGLEGLKREMRRVIYRRIKRYVIAVLRDVPILSAETARALAVLLDDVACNRKD